MGSRQLRNHTNPRLCPRGSFQRKGAPIGGLAPRLRQRKAHTTYMRPVGSADEAVRVAFDDFPGTELGIFIQRLANLELKAVKCVLRTGPGASIVSYKLLRSIQIYNGMLFSRVLGWQVNKRHLCRLLLSRLVLWDGAFRSIDQNKFGVEDLFQPLQALWEIHCVCTDLLWWIASRR